MKRILAGFAMVSWCWSLAVRAAMPYTESFAAETAIAPPVFLLGGGEAAVTDGGVRVLFYDTAPFAVPDRVALVMTAPAFTGNYVQAGVETIGFRLHTADSPPTMLYLELASGTSVFQRVLSHPGRSGWHTFMADVAGGPGSGWMAKRGGGGDVSAALTQVDRITLHLVRSGADTQRFVVDDVFINARPELLVEPSADHHGVIMDMATLQPGARYLIESSAQLNGNWQEVGLWNADESFESIWWPAAQQGDELRFFRIRGQ